VETIEEVKRIIQVDVLPDEPRTFAHQETAYLLSLGLPESWLPAVREIRTDGHLISVCERLPAEVAERLEPPRRRRSVQTRLRKQLPNLAPSFEYEPPVWQLRVGVFRVFYDVDDLAGEVHVRAVRRKKPHQRTEDIT